MSSALVRRPRSILGPHIWCVCVSLVCGIEEETGWGCSVDTLWEEGWAACCEYFGRFALKVQSSGSDKGCERHVLLAVESSGGLYRWDESPEGWSCKGGEGCKVGMAPWGSLQRGAGRYMTTMYSWVHPVWVQRQRTCRPGAVPSLSCRGSQWDPRQGCWLEDEGRRRGDSKTRPHSENCKWRVSCRSGGGFLESSSPLLQRDREKILCWFSFSFDVNDKWELKKFQLRVSNSLLQRDVCVLIKLHRFPWVALMIGWAITLV